MSIRFHFTEILQGFVVRARCRLNSSLLGAAIVAHPGWTIPKRPDGPALASRSTFLRNLNKCPGPCLLTYLHTILVRPTFVSIRFHLTEILQGFIVRAHCRLNRSLFDAAIVAHPQTTQA